MNPRETRRRVGRLQEDARVLAIECITEGVLAPQVIAARSLVFLVEAVRVSHKEYTQAEAEAVLARFWQRLHELEVVTS